MLNHLNQMRLKINQSYIQGVKLTDGLMLSMSQNLDHLLNDYHRLKQHRKPIKNEIGNKIYGKWE